MLRIAVAGVTGRMGKVIVEAIQKSSDIKLGAASVRPGHQAIGRDVGEACGLSIRGITVVDDLEADLDDFDVLIDFTSPEATLSHLSLCVPAGKKMIIGTTGFTAEDRAYIAAASEDTAIVLSPNMSIGMNLCLELLRQAAGVMNKNKGDYVQITDRHHRHKKDVPSGTAVQMSKIVENAEYSPSDIHIESVRASDVVGDHIASFISGDELVKITHVASNRTAYATGALRAAQWIAAKKSGLFNMQAVLGLWEE